MLPVTPTFGINFGQKNLLTAVPIKSPILFSGLVFFDQSLRVHISFIFFERARIDVKLVEERFGIFLIHCHCLYFIYPVSVPFFKSTFFKELFESSDTTPNRNCSFSGIATSSSKKCFILKFQQTFCLQVPFSHLSEKIGFRFENVGTFSIEPFLA